MAASLSFLSLIGFTWPAVSPRAWSLALTLVDIGLVLGLTYIVLLVIAERRTLWMVRGFIFLIFAASISRGLGLQFLAFVLNNLVVGSAVAMAVILQSEIRRFLEQLGQGKVFQILQRNPTSTQRGQTTLDAIVEAVKALSQSRTGALILLETETMLDAQDFTATGVRLNASLTSELVQTIFQPATPLHDGAILIRGSEIVAAKLILPLSQRTGPWQLGTRHRAAVGITERVANCLCIVVSEETGSISLAQRGELNRPLTSSKLKELLEQHFNQAGDNNSHQPQRSVKRRRWQMVWPIR